MVSDLEQNIFGTFRVFDIKFVIAEFIVNDKMLFAKIEFEPHFDRSVGFKSRYFRTEKFFDMVGEIIEKYDAGKIRKMPCVVA